MSSIQWIDYEMNIQCSRKDCNGWLERSIFKRDGKILWVAPPQCDKSYYHKK